MKIDAMIKAAAEKRVKLLDALKAQGDKIEAVLGDDAAYEAETKAYGDIEASLEDLNAEMKSLQEKQADMLARAKRVESLIGDDADDASIENLTAQKGATMNAPVVAKYSHEKGADYSGAVEIRSLIVSHMAKAHGASKKDVADALFPNDKRVHAITRAAVPIPGTGTVGIGSELVVQANAQAELIDLLRNSLLYPQMPGMRTLPIPANSKSVRIPRTTGAVSASWVGEGNSIPVSTNSFDSITLTFNKMGVITLSTRELLERSDPAYEQILRDQIIKGVAEGVDTTFASDVAGTAVSPAGIFAAAVTVAGAGTLPAAPTAAQAIAFINAFKLQVMLANMNVSNFVWVMRPETVVGLMSLRSAIDSPLFPEMSAGQLQGHRYIMATNFPATMPVSGNRIVGFVDASELWFGLGSGLALATSDSAYIQSDTAPNTPPTGGVSLFQQEMTAIRAVLETGWAVRRSGAVLQAPTLL